MTAIFTASYTTLRDTILAVRCDDFPLLAPPSRNRLTAVGYGNRNSFVVFPLALALPVEWQLATVDIIHQALVELFGILMLRCLLPNLIFRGRLSRRNANMAEGTVG